MCKFSKWALPNLFYFAEVSAAYQPNCDLSTLMGKVVLWSSLKIEVTMGKVGGKEIKHRVTLFMDDP